jgi:Uma2 family endonuclease
LVAVQDYLSTTYRPDRDYVDGEIIQRDTGESEHAGLQGWLIALIHERRREAGIHIFPEIRLQVSARRYRIPDVAVTTAKVSRGVLREPPFLCVEILSPEDRMSRVEARIDDFLSFGVRYVWLIDPRRMKAWSYTAGIRSEVADALRTAHPEISISLHELFSALEDDVDSE